MLKLTSIQGQTVYVNPDAIISVEKFPNSEYTTIHTVGPQSPSHFCILVTEAPEVISTQWREAVRHTSAG
jgi:hypothetical protein